MAVPCIVCLQEIAIRYNNGVFTGDETTHVMYAGDAKYEAGRYNIHERCNHSNFRDQILTRDMLDGKVPLRPGILQAASPYLVKRGLAETHN